MTREEEFLKKQELFRRNAFLIITEMVAWSPVHPSELVDEVLHSIFFLGKFIIPQYNPESILSDDDMLNTLKTVYPNPFQLYSSQLPKRSPVSCVLDMIVGITGQENEGEIKECLQKLMLRLMQDDATYLISSTICVSQLKNLSDSHRYYGVSMSTFGPMPGRIVTAASCLSYWDSCVAGAVMTYDFKKIKKTYFDGTIQLPENSVRCEAFSISRGTQMPPCRSCGNLFGLTTSEERQWPYGNCAEVESVSNLLKNETELKEQVRPTSETSTDVNRREAEESVRKELMNCLKTVEFKWDECFYTPKKR
uniref:uncharacterized protein LOC124074311 isoform X1 n=1 Tax=Scatophagus argus TaxID=75038 RepID=UPI001ED7F348|nr:uncharacterized protein LOC124074311 isoform X1 [Scatophagus argus]XP_046273043.1 uncharacterized protein LOC124074311 isoform X1 [Scatophagus argus]